MLGCGGASSEEENISLKVINIKQSIEEKYKEHPDAKFCDAFNMTNADIKSFFKSAKLITPNERHYQYAWSPCSVVISIEKNGKSSQWKIYASGVAEMIGNNGNVLGCKKCGKPFFEFGTVED